MAYSPKRAAAVKNGKVVFNIYDEEGKLFESCPNFLIAVKRAEFLQDTYPGKKFDMKVELAKGEKL